jgi:hypothetical protein
MNFANIFEAAEKGTVEDVRYFVEEKGININAINANSGRRAPIHEATYNLDLEVIKYLISKGADVNALDGIDCWTPLHYAANNNYIETVKYLISKGADINARCARNSTPLHKVAYGPADGPPAAIEILKYLISKGADVNAKDIQGKKPIDWATCSEEKKRILREAGSGGCYVATAVYGSYDAPEVLCLRRFRDEILVPSIFGRMFISLYYRFSPPIAERLKEARRINMFVRKTLDKIVVRLNKKFHDKNEEV